MPVIIEDRIAKKMTRQERDFIKLLEQELVAVNRSLRHLNNKRRKFTDRFCHTIIKQKWRMNLGKFAIDNVDEDLRQANCPGNKRRNEWNSVVIKSLMEHEEQMDELLARGQERVRVQEMKVEKLNNKIMVQKKYNLKYAPRYGGARLEQEIEHMEKIILKIMRQYNGTLEVCRQIKMAIEHIRGERDLFETYGLRLTTEVDGLRTKIAHNVDEATDSYVSKEIANTKSEAMIDHDTKQTFSNNADLLDLYRFIDADKKLKAFFHKKNNMRLEYKAETLKQKHAPEASALEDKDYFRLDKAFEEIKLVTGVVSADKIMNKYLSKENENFAQYINVNDLRNEKDILQDAINELNDKSVTVTMDVNDGTMRKMDVLAELEDKSNLSSKIQYDIDKRNLELIEMLGGVNKTVQSIFELIGCDNSTILNKLASDTGVTDNNTMEHLSLIEDRVNDFLEVHNFELYKLVPREEHDEHVAAFRAKKLDVYRKSVVGHSIQLNYIVVPPKYTNDHHDFEMYDENDRPLLYEELKELVVTKIKKMELDHHPHNRHKHSKGHHKMIRVV